MLVTILALNYAKTYYIFENWWRCSSYAYKQIWILCQREISNLGLVFKVKRSKKEHSGFCQPFYKNFLFSLDWIPLVTTSIKHFSFFLNRSIRTDFISIFVFLEVAVNDLWPLKGQGKKLSKHSHVGCQMKALLMRNNNMKEVFQFKWPYMI